MAIKNEILQSSSGAKLNLYSNIPQNPKAIIQINHGMAEHAGRYENFMESLGDAGFAAYAHDHRGHGKTTARDAHQGFFGKPDGFGKILNDVDFIIETIKSRHKGMPIVCFGHSMGSIVALNYAIKHSDKIFALACWNSGVDGGALAIIAKILLRIEAYFKGSDVPSLLAQSLTFTPWNKTFAPNRTDFDWLSSDEQEVDKYIADPLCGFPVTNKLWQELLGAVQFAGKDRALSAIGLSAIGLGAIRKSLPIHLLGGDQDPCTQNGKAMANLKNRFDTMGYQNTTLEIKKGARHETLNEVERGAYMLDFIAWLEQQI